MKKFLATLGLVCLSALSAFAQGSRTDGVVFKTGVGVPGVNVAVCQPVATTAAVVVSNIASLTLTGNPVNLGFVPNMSLTVAGFSASDFYFNGTFTILSVTSTNITYSLSHANATATTSGTALQKGNTTTSCAGLANIYTDTTDVGLATNPFLSDSLGNYSFNAPPGLYYIQFYSPAILTRFSAVMVNCAPLGVGCTSGGGGGGNVSGAILAGQVGYGSSTNTLTSDPNFLWNAGLQTLKIGAPGSQDFSVIGAPLAQPGGAGVLSPGIVAAISPGLDFTDNSKANPFASVWGYYANMTTGLDGVNAADQEAIIEANLSCSSTNGSSCTPLQAVSVVTDASGQNPFGNPVANGTYGNATINIAGSNGRANGATGIATTTGPSSRAFGLQGIANATGTNSQANGGYFDAVCSGGGCTAHAIYSDRGDWFLNNSGFTAGTSGQVITSQGPNTNPIWASPTATWAGLVAGTNSNAGTFALSGNTWDAHLAAHTLPVVTGAIGSIPATCTVGEVYFSTSATNGQNLYLCTSTNVFTQQLNSGAGGASAALSNLAAVAINTTLLPGAVNTVALGSATLPFTNVFLGTVASKASSFDTSALTANRSIKLVDAAMVIPQPLTAVAHQFATALSGTTGAFTLAQPTLADVAAGVAPTGTFDFSGVTLFKGRVGAGLTTTVNGDFGYDTTNKNWHAWQNAADHIVGVFDGTQINGDCVISLIAASVVNLSDGGGCVTAASSTTFTNKPFNAEGTGNSLSLPIKAYFAAAGCNQSTAGNAFDIGTSNAPTAQCDGTTGRKGKLLMVRGNVVYINWHLPPDWNSSAATDIELGLTSTDVTNGHVISFNVQTGCNKNDGTATDDPSFNALQALNITIGASQVAGGALKGTLTGLTMTGCSADYDFEIALTRNNSGTDTATNPGATTAGSEAFLKFAELTLGVTKNAANR